MSIDHRSDRISGPTLQEALDAAKAECLKSLHEMGPLYDETEEEWEAGNDYPTGYIADVNCIWEASVAPLSYEDAMRLAQTYSYPDAPEAVALPLLPGPGSEPEWLVLYNARY